ncbi:MAG TPA: hypothetical protein VM582_09555 [Candidatus Thermoplasmatota archaeon]|nr:hypothetical protein [Candidatus Thermoplasmatota archaeon]
MSPRNDARRMVTILANAECPHCAHATDTLADWCVEAGVPVAGIDVAHHPEVARRWNLEHSPALVVETERGAQLYPGFPSHQEFLRMTGTR